MKQRQDAVLWFAHLTYGQRLSRREKVPTVSEGSLLADLRKSFYTIWQSDDHKAKKEVRVCVYVSTLRGQQSLNRASSGH